MDLRFHFLACTILTIIFYPVFGLYSLLVFIGGFFVDADHYLYTAIVTRNIGLKKAYLFYKTPWEKRKLILHVFHTVEIWALLLVMSFFYKEAAIISAGLVIHMIMDFFDSYRLGYQVSDIRATSILEWIKKRNTMTYSPLFNHLRKRLKSEDRIL